VLKNPGKLIVVRAIERAASYSLVRMMTSRPASETGRPYAASGRSSTACKESGTMARKLEKSVWQAYFDVMSKALVGKRAEIEVASLKLGDQIEAEWLPLLGITYDPKDDLIEVALDGHDHLINKPREVYVEDEQLGLASLEVIDAEDVRQIVILRDPLMLPPPAQSAAKAG
jgi:Family of unknown function (DUF5335)